MPEQITLPYTPRSIMLPFHDRTERFACLVAHRRCGKTVAAVNDLIRDAFVIPRENVRVAYIAPYFNQSKAIAWDYVKQFGADPGHEVQRIRVAR